MKIAILGNGKMGKEISTLAQERGHIIACTSSSKHPTNSLNLKNIDLAIEFSTPDTAFSNISYALKNNIPVVSGTTGWENNLNEIKMLCKAYKGSFLYSSNFSIGMNIFFEINRNIAQLIQKQEYKIYIKEIHHTTKKDKPSGTAKELAADIQSILKYSPTIHTKRIKDVVGDHIIDFDSLFENIQIKHTAKNRKTFAIGALLAGEWLIGKTGIFSMKDVLDIKDKL